MIHAAQATPGGDHLRREAGDPALEVRRRPCPLAVAGDGEHDVGELGGRVGRVPTATRKRHLLEGARGEVPVGEVGERVGAEQHEHVELARGRGRRACPRCRAHRPPGAAPQRSSKKRPAAPRARPGPGAARGRGPCRARRARSPRRSAGRNLAPGRRRRGSAAAAATCSADSASDGRPSTTTMPSPAAGVAVAGGEQASGRVEAATVEHDGVVGRRRGPGEGPGEADGLAGPVGEARPRRAGVSAVGDRRALDDLEAVVHRGGPQPQEQDRELLAEVAGEQRRPSTR